MAVLDQRQIFALHCLCKASSISCRQAPNRHIPLETYEDDKSMKQLTNAHQTLLIHACMHDYLSLRSRLRLAFEAKEGRKERKKEDLPRCQPHMQHSLICQTFILFLLPIRESTLKKLAVSKHDQNTQRLGWKKQPFYVLYGLLTKVPSNL